MFRPNGSTHETERNLPLAEPAAARVAVMPRANRLLTLTLGAVLFTVLVMAGSFGRGQAADLGPGIHVTGTGVVYGEPDTAVLDVGVSTVAEDVKLAMAEADEIMNAVRAAAVAAGVAEEDVVTTGLHVWRDERLDSEGNTTATRFQVRHSYRLTVRNVDAAGEVLAAVVDAGANEVGGISFTLSDAGALAEEARNMALRDAEVRANGLAVAAGLELGAPTAISELEVGPEPQFRQAAMMDAGGSSIASGQLAIAVTVQVSYALDGAR